MFSSKIFLALAVSTVAGLAQADVLTFDPIGNCNASGVRVDCVNANAFHPDYGDTASIDVTTFDGLGGSPGLGMRYYSSLPGDPLGTYVGLTHVATSGGAAAVAVIRLTPLLSGASVTLNSLDVSRYDFQPSYSTRIDVIDLLNGSVVFAYVNPALSGLATLVPNVTSTSGLEIRFGPDAFNTAIDNVNFTVATGGGGGGGGATVPEPSSLALLALGSLGGMMTLMRRRRR